MKNVILDVVYLQIAVFNSNIDMPFNDWSHAQVKQGFCWRKGSVSFKTMKNGPTSISPKIEVDFVQDNNAERVISVPFECDQDGNVEISTIVDSENIKIQPGSYQLIFETGSNPECWCKLYFIKDGDLEAKIIVADDDLSPTLPLDMSANSA